MGKDLYALRIDSELTALREWLVHMLGIYLQEKEGEIYSRARAAVLASPNVRPVGLADDIRDDCVEFVDFCFDDFRRTRGL